ncbi:CDP-diacylglycerol diphosphatase [Mesorhizobium sp. SARCC-RB16n]|uniref:CDP-diacylglycerol diphosphatase n=1 Tax=Mesorhizobium sp. SARCC-RB16n TaxID=2116687 RepID=UPI00166A1075|nr:CDP-diacylglycerol diphosphatase [Mesorhizobium sp. SARCC-RB16n]
MAMQGFFAGDRWLRLMVVLLMGVSATVACASFKREVLWEAVRICALTSVHYGAAFPCEEVILPQDGEFGWTLIKSPLQRTEFLLTPISAVTGLESPLARSTAGAQLWSEAWEARWKVEAKLGHSLPRSAIGLAVNSRTERSQDQMHIHVDCLSKSVERTLALGGPKTAAPWQPSPIMLKGRPYWIMAVDKPDLRTTNVVGLVVSGLPHALRAIEDLNVIVVGATLADAKPGFYILANLGQAGERLLDHKCTSR